MPPQRLSDEIRRMLARQVTPGADEETRRRELGGGGEMSVVQAMALKQVERALDGDLKACAFVSQYAGEEDTAAAPAANLETLLRLLEEQSDDPSHS